MPRGEASMCKACLCAGKLGKRASPGSKDVRKWRKVVGEGGDSEFPVG